MKRHLYTILTIFFLSQSLFGFGGEIKVLIVNTTTQKFKLDVSTDQYAWIWDKVNSKVVFLSSYSYSSGTTWASTVAFDAPNDNNGNGAGVIPWGLMNFSITSNDGSQYTLDFTLDLRDENWAVWGNYQSSSDAYILLDAVTRNIYLAKSPTISPGDIIINSSTQNIWVFWNVGGPLQENFKVPVTLLNKVEEDQNTSFGYLNANGHQVTSGNDESFYHDVNQSVSQGTPNTIYNNQEHYSFKWSNSSGVNIGSNPNIYTTNLNFSTGIEKQDKSITRNFRAVYPLAIKTALMKQGV